MHSFQIGRAAGSLDQIHKAWKLWLDVNLSNRDIVLASYETGTDLLFDHSGKPSESWH
jgi:hypothetical protein